MSDHGGLGRRGVRGIGQFAGQQGLDSDSNGFANLRRGESELKSQVVGGRSDGSQQCGLSGTHGIGQYLADMEGTSGKPRAILMGAGGNDLVDPPTRPRATALYRLLKAGATDAATALIEAEVKAFIDTTLFKHYVSILDVVTANSTAIPILIHAYDHPIPDGRRFEGIAGLGVRGPWLQKVFDAKNVTQDIDIRREIMKALIERLNKMVKGLETHYPGRVFHLQLNGELAKQPGYGQDHKTYWSNELHASAKGFDALAQVVKAQLVARGVT